MSGDQARTIEETTMQMTVKMSLAARIAQATRMLKNNHAPEDVAHYCALPYRAVIALIGG
jgi:hypothetical protein